MSSKSRRVNSWQKGEHMLLSVVCCSSVQGYVELGSCSMGIATSNKQKNTGVVIDP